MEEKREMSKKNIENLGRKIDLNWPRLLLIKLAIIE
jgi:hypothetical protein